MFSKRGWIFFILSASFFLLNFCLLNCVVGADVGSSSGVGRGLRIDIIRKRSIQVNEVEVDENSLLDHLEDHEKELIFGKSKTKREVRLVHLKHRTDAAVPTTITTTETTTKAAAAASWEAPKQQKLQQKHQRVKRSDITTAPPVQSGAQPTQEVSIQIQDGDADLVNFHLRPAPKLIDDAFIFIGRYANTTQLIGDSHAFAERYANCFYRNDKSAIDLCDEGLNVRGILHHNATDFFIHPLPRRFGNSTHVIVAAVDNPHNSHHDLVASEWPFTSEEERLDSNLQFEPDEEDFNEVERPLRGHSILGERLKDHFEDQPQRQSQSTVNQYHQKIRLPTSHARSSYQPRYHSDQQPQPQTHHRQHHLHHLSSENQRNQHHGNGNRDRDRDQQQRIRRQRRHIQSDSQWSNSRVLDIETAVFVDSDLFKHMAKNFPDDTEAHLFRFVLAMINGVQRLYHDPSLRHRVNFVLKRLEILYNERADLRRSSDIDTYLSNFCMWQRSFNPTSDADAAHYDHAVILTGLDLYVMGKNGKVISQVVGLAPVAGMCSPTSSCTINEGKHFESVFVVAHEIGHNLGMRHDTKENSCDPTLYIMSPTLGSGKITWSKCSRSYLDLFLNSHQAKCLQNRGQVARDLDHSAGGLPGERFDANKQCMLKYGKGTVQAHSQLISDVCRDLHCQRDRYTWTSHPALEGTECGDNMWCRSGVCKSKPSTTETHAAPKQLQTAGKFGYDKASFLESSKMGHLHEYNYNKSPLWEDWGKASECDSGCLYGPTKRLREGSTGLKTYTRRCLDHQRMCPGHDRKFESCIAKQCYSIDITTIEDFARREVCEKAQKFDPELTGEGLQIAGKIEESCKVFCKTKSNGTKSRRATFPDGTTCHSTEYHFHDTAYCIAGRCERFTCDNSTNNYFKIDPIFCQYRKPGSSQAPAPPSFENRRWNDNKQLHITYNRYADRGTGAPATTTRSKYENEVVSRNYHGLQQYQNQVYKRKLDPWNKYNYHLNEPYSKSPAATPHLQKPQPQSSQSSQSSPSPPLAAAAPVAASLVRVPMESDWIVKSGCHSSCMAKSRGIQVVSSRRTGAKNIQLCTHTVKPCERLQTATEYADNTCARYKLKVRGLSGHGTQIAASIDEPDRSCRVGCQDEQITYRFYLVNGKYGHFPLGTKCSNTEERYCVNGKCLEFGPDKIPLQESHISLALFRSRRSLASPVTPRINRTKRSYLYYEPVNITETITQDFINNIIDGITEEENFSEEAGASDMANIDLNQPIHVTTEEELIPK